MSRFSKFPRSARAFFIVGGLVMVWVGASAASDAMYRRHHPAPLGRTVADVERLLAARLPNGVTVDSASHYLNGAGLETALERPSNGPQASRAPDSLAAGGPVLAGIERDVDASLFVTRGIRLKLYFDTSGHLIRRSVRSVFTGP